MPSTLLLLLATACMESWLIPIPQDKDTGTAPSPIEMDTGRLPPPDEPESCDPFPEPDPYDPARNESCEGTATDTPGTFSPVVEWHWTDAGIAPEYDNVMSTPVVANLDDDNGDGVVDDLDTPEVIFIAFKGGSYSSPGALTVLDGRTGAEIWARTEVSGFGFFPTGMVAVGDLEGNGSPAICASGTTTSVVCVTPWGNLLWASGAHPNICGAPAIADLDGDGSAEVVYGSEVFDAKGNLVGASPLGTLTTAYYTVPADVNGDGKLEIVAGNHVFNADGGVLWSNGDYDAFPAVADFDADGQPEIVRTGADNRVELVDMDGTELWSVEYPGGCGGPAVVADLDGDREPEIGAGGMNQYVVFDTDGTVLWSQPTQDGSSCLTGSSAFDFEGDGVSEIVYADEQTLWVFSGPDGAVKLKYDQHSSGTLFEYPIIADVDGDGQAEIIAGSNDYYFKGSRGITVLGSNDGSWAQVRPIWNQHAYHVTNVNDDSTLPESQTPSWLAGNTFRTAHGVEGPPTSASADLAPGRLEPCLETCSEDRVTFWVSMENRGLATGSAFHVRLEPLDEGLPAMDYTVSTLEGGQADWLGPVTLTSAQWGTALTLVVDADDDVSECEESNNTLDLGPWPCPE